VVPFSALPKNEPLLPLCASEASTKHLFLVNLGYAHISNICPISIILKFFHPKKLKLLITLGDMAKKRIFTTVEFFYCQNEKL
jgi:hypothetical protein